VASKSHCEECLRLTNLFLDRISYHVRLIEEEQRRTIHESREDVADIQLRIVETEERIDEAHRVLSEHRSTHFLTAPDGKKTSERHVIGYCVAAIVAAFDNFVFSREWRKHLRRIWPPLRS
jgi:hypothetical protein